MYYHVTLFLKIINTSLSSCSLRDGTINLIKYASRILLLRVFPGAVVRTYQLNSCSMFLAKCVAGSEFLLTSHFDILTLLTQSAKRVQLWIDTQSSCLGSGNQRFPHFLPAKTAIKNTTKTSKSHLPNGFCWHSKWPIFFILFVNNHCASWIDFTLFCMERNLALTFKAIFSVKLMH